MAETKDSVVPLRPTRPCPTCGQPSDRKYYPFCSERCQGRDLNRWLSGTYTIPVVEEDGGDSGDSGGGSGGGDGGDGGGD